MSDRGGGVVGRGGAAGPARAVEDLARRYRLGESAATALLALVELVASDRHAPTGVRDARAAVDVHVADSLVALDLPEVRRARTIADIGSGAGFPGLALALALPETRVALVEANGRRAEFLRRAVAATGAVRAIVVAGRAEEWDEGRAANELVVVRAVAPLAVVAEYAAPLLVPGGALVAWRGQRDAEVERAGARAATELGLEPREVRHVVPYVGAEHRYLHVMVKVQETPDRFPRRAGMASKRPLGGLSGPPRRRLPRRRV